MASFTQQSATMMSSVPQGPRCLRGEPSIASGGNGNGLDRATGEDRFEPSRNSVVAPVRRGLVAALFALGVNLLLFGALASLNRPRTLETGERRSIRLHAAPTAPRSRPLPVHAKAAPPEPAAELRQATLDSPAPPPEPRPVAVPAIRMPEIGVEALPVPAVLASATAQSGEAVAAVAVLDSGEVDEPPRKLANRLPAYPRAAERRRIEGSVTLRLLIDERGRVERTQVIAVEGHPAFEDAVLAVIGGWHFSPARHRGREVKVWGVTTLEFRLKRP
jgi:protein TonB